jgi:hypothetical protein
MAAVAVILSGLVVALLGYGFINVLASDLIAEMLLDPAKQGVPIDVFRDDVLPQVNAGWFLFCMVGFGLALVWLARILIGPPEGPGEALRLKVWWWSLLIICMAMGGALFAYYFNTVENIGPTAYFELIVAGVLVPGLLYVCVTFFTTPKIVRTAIPLAAIVLTE